MPTSATLLEFTPGTILVRETSFAPFLFHYGVGISTEEVIHKMVGVGVVSTSFEAFAEGLDVTRSDFYSRRNSDPQVTIERARSAVGKRDYRFIDNNCEAFVFWCLTGEHSRGVQGEVLNVVGILAGLWKPEAPKKTTKRLSPYGSLWDDAPTKRPQGLHEESLAKSRQALDETLQRSRAQCDASLARAKARLDRK